MYKLIIFIFLFSLSVGADVPNSFSSGETIDASKMNQNFNSLKTRYYRYDLPSAINGDDTGVGYAHNLTTFQLKPNQLYRFTLAFTVSLDTNDGFALHICRGLALATSSESSDQISGNPACKNPDGSPNLFPTEMSSGFTHPNGTTTNFGANVSSTKFITTQNTGSNIDYTLQVISLSNDSRLSAVTLIIEELNHHEQVNSLVD